jgi:three-Cys-motif partner protein
MPNSHPAGRNLAALNLSFNDRSGKQPLKKERDDDGNDLRLFPEHAVERKLHSRSNRRGKGWFDVQRTASAVKTKIVVDYFAAWANVMKNKTRSEKIGYLDFFSGPGVYEDGTESTPLQIMRIILADERLRNITLTLFEDKNPEAVDSLSKALAALDGFQDLKHPPNISHGEAARRDIVQYFATRALIPTFMFLDPFGYAGLTRDLMKAILKDWGCEMAFYFNFNRINAALRNKKVRAHMDNLFGSDRVDAARAALVGVKDAGTRESILLGGMQEVLYEIGAKHVLCFRFCKASGALDHHLVFATKNLDPAQKIMKGIMSRASSAIDADGIGSFEYNPTVTGAAFPFDVATPMQLLQRDLLERFHGRRLSVSQIYELHNEGTTFTIKNYQDALRQLAYDEHAVKVERGEFMPLTEVSVRKRHMSESYRITFPD